jgi:hypothetical protein
MKEQGPALQAQINDKTKLLANGLNAVCEEKSLPLHVVHFGSLWKIKFKEEVLHGELLFTLMRYKGIHIWDLFPCFLTEAFTEEHIQQIISVFTESVQEMLHAKIFFSPDIPAARTMKAALDNTPPYAGARLGKDSNGNPGWFIQDPQRPGKYLQVNTKDKVNVYD